MSLQKLRGKAWVFEGLLDVDRDIFPSYIQRQLREKQVPLTEEELGKWALHTLDPDFSKKIKKGDFVVAGENVGYGHDHARASMSLKGAGVGAVLCESTNRYFFRNSVDLGLPVVECPALRGKIKQGDELEVDLASGTIRNLTTGDRFAFPPYPDFILNIIESGGLYPLLREQLKTRPSSISSPQRRRG